MKRAAALLLLAGLLLALSGCGCGGLEPALEAVRGWDAARRWGCRFNALRAEGALVVAACARAAARDRRRAGAVPAGGLRAVHRRALKSRRCNIWNNGAPLLAH